jgi:polar amino acid transport system substrate-binding protein
MKRRGWSLGVAMVLAATASASAMDLADVRSRGTLRVLVVRPAGPAFFFDIDGGPQPGFDREILELFAQHHHFRVEPVPVPSWDRLIPSLLEGKGDAIAGGVSKTPQRAQLIAFSEIVFPTRHVVVTRKPQPPVRSLEELRRQRVGVMKGTSMVGVLAEARVPAGQVDDSITNLAEALRAGRITAYVTGIERALPLQHDDPELQIGMTLGSADELAFGVRKADVQLLAALDEFIRNFRRTPTWSRLVVKYFGDAALTILQTARPQ